MGYLLAKFASLHITKSSFWSIWLEVLVTKFIIESSPSLRISKRIKVSVENFIKPCFANSQRFSFYLRTFRNPDKFYLNDQEKIAILVSDLEVLIFYLKKMPKEHLLLKNDFSLS